MPRNKKTPRRKAKKARTSIPQKTRSEVLRRCRRRCCICYGLRRTLDPADGQIAHLDRDRTNATIKNLAYLCLDCHKIYDSQSNRVLGFTSDEIENYRAQLYRALGYDQIEWTISVRGDRAHYAAVKERIERAHEMLRTSGADVTLTETSLD